VNKNKKFIIGGVIGLVIIVSIILGVTLSKSKEPVIDDGGDGINSNPMIGIYASEPSFI
jgi:hypothetical protein